MINTKDIQDKDVRNFGLLLGVVLLGISLWPWLKHDATPNVVLLSIASVFAVGGIFVPRALQPIYQLWMKIGFVLGWINTRIILSLGFFGIFTPVGIIMRMVGHDPMRRRFDSTRRTYRVQRTIRDGEHMEHQY